MAFITSNHPIRIARPSASLAAAEIFWTEGVGLEVLWRSIGHVEGDHALLMVGPPDAGWHLELVDDPSALADNPPGPEDLLVIYRGVALDDGDLTRMEASGGRRVTARNPYWDKYGVTIQDPDGYLLVISHRLWGRSA